jgi:hypothetical protein
MGGGGVQADRPGIPTSIETNQNRLNKAMDFLMNTMASLQQFRDAAQSRLLQQRVGKLNARTRYQQHRSEQYSYLFRMEIAKCEYFVTFAPAVNSAR